MGTVGHDTIHSRSFTEVVSRHCPDVMASVLLASIYKHHTIMRATTQCSRSVLHLYSRAGHVGESCRGQLMRSRERWEAHGGESRAAIGRTTSSRTLFQRQDEAKKDGARQLQLLIQRYPTSNPPNSTIIPAIIAPGQAPSGMLTWHMGPIKQRGESVDGASRPPCLIKHKVMPRFMPRAAPAPCKFPPRMAMDM